MNYLQYLLKCYAIKMYNNVDLNHDYISEQHRYYLRLLVDSYKYQINQKIHKQRDGNSNRKFSENEIYAEVQWTEGLLYRISRLFKLMLYGEYPDNIMEQSISVFRLGQMQQSIFATVCNEVSTRKGGVMTVFDEITDNKNTYVEMICGIQLIDVKPGTKLKTNTLLTCGWETPQDILDLKQYSIDELNFLVGCLDCYQLEADTFSKNISKILGSP